MYDLIIVGAGPCGIAAALEAERRGLRYLVLEQGSVCMSLTKYPIYMTFASSPENLELGGHPFPTGGEKPTRLEAIRYFRRVAEVEGIKVHQYEKVTSVEAGFLVRTRRRDGSEAAYQAANIALAIGYFDHPNLLGIPGEENPERCSHFYTEPSPYYGMNVAVVGGKNSAVEAALQLCRAGVKVSLIYRRAELPASVKPWVRPDIENRIKTGAIPAYFGTHLRSINPTTVTLERDGQTFELENDFVFALTGYSPDQTVLRHLGVAIDEATGKPAYDEATMETNVPGLFLVGVIAAGYDANKIFIENGRFHGKAVVDTILSRR
ncbi:MAG TPA: YpdA family putative bacillithiol disulfide reductase [Symbiobacteriaceae bacterium]|nr:YpdA family putative bacillithiol disulfide reductase [Symbiobacteriaceae bacterium]